MMLHPTHSPCSIEGGTLRIDRKFHVGMLRYAEALRIEPIVLAPAMAEGSSLMDCVEVSTSTIPYRVETVQCDGQFRVGPRDRDRVESLVRAAKLLYGTGFGSQRFARALGTPYIPVLEYNLRTQIEVARMPVTGSIRRAVRAARAIGRFVRLDLPDIRGAMAVHCNGYPIYEQTRRLHPDCLLYLDSRMALDMVIEREDLEARLSSLQSGRVPRLLYSGRYEALKGALDVVSVGLELAGRGVAFELDLYGKGDQADAMRARVAAAGAGERIRVHDAIPYPELVARSKRADLFVCCHRQDDPSCTYLEAAGAGLPIAGYGNRMWRSFAEAAGNGVVSPMGKPGRLADAIEARLRDRSLLAEESRRSRAFAAEHAFEREFAKRIEALRPLLVG